MYSMKHDTYTCDLCGCELDWDGGDYVRGTMWGCERCGIYFCSKCFIDRCGRDAYDSMLQERDEILCPDCYGKPAKPAKSCQDLKAEKSQKNSLTKKGHSQVQEE